ncbi:hypothetical protein BRD18_00700, partial [Halobacteriales archaeon SW_7_71_33]
PTDVFCRAIVAASTVGYGDLTEPVLSELDSDGVGFVAVTPEADTETDTGRGEGVEADTGGGPDS